MVACYSFYLFKKDFLTSYKLDFLIAGGLLLVDLIYYLGRSEERRVGKECRL